MVENMKMEGGEGVTEAARSGTSESGLTAEERQRAIDLIAEAEAERRISGKAVFDKGKFRPAKHRSVKKFLLCVCPM